MSTSKSTTSKTQTAKVSSKQLTEPKPLSIEQRYSQLKQTLDGTDGLKWCYPPDENCKRKIDQGVVID